MGVEELAREGASHIAAVDPRMRDVIHSVGSCRLAARRARFPALVRAIVGQQVSTSAARAVHQRLRLLAGGRLVPARVAELTDAELRAAGLSRQKAGYIRDLSERVATGTLRLDRLTAHDDAAVIDELTAVKGIGRWTAEMFLIFVLNRPDVLPLKDLGIQKGFVHVYGLRRRPSDARMRKLALAWRPYRTVGSWYLWRSLDLPRPLRR